jgi:glycosyltransferase involved in cell wall biosynthesis
MKQHQPQISVLVPVRNGALFIEQAVRSVLAQSCSDLRIVASDNRSTDATAAILQRLAADPRLCVIRQPALLSMFRHFNDCLARVETDFFMLLCHDDYLASRDALRTARDVLLSHPDVNAVYCDILFVDGRGKRIATRRFGRNGRFDAPATARSSILAGRNLFGIPLLVRTRAVRGLSYDEALSYTADVDMSIGGAAGGALFHLPQPLIANRYHAGNATWGVVGGVSAQMRVIAAKHGISLSAFDRLRATANAFLMAVTKMLLFAYLCIRR